LTVTGSTLRTRSAEYKTRLISDFGKYALPLFESGTLRPIIAKTLSWAEVAEAHNYVEANQNIGKVVLKVD